MAKDEKQSFVFFHDWRESLREYPARVRREVYEAIVEYSVTGEVPEMSDKARLAFAFIRPDMDRTRSKYEEICRKRKEAISKRWEDKKIQNDTKNTNVDFVIHNDNDNDNVNDNDNDNDLSVNTERERGVQGGTSPPARDLAEEIQNLWNELLGDKLPKVAKLSDKRRLKVPRRLGEWGKTPDEGLAKAREIFDRMARSDFLLGGGGSGWTANFDWLFDSPNNWVKVMEGNYDNKQKKPKNYENNHGTENGGYDRRGGVVIHDFDGKDYGGGF